MLTIIKYQHSSKPFSLAVMFCRHQMRLFFAILLILITSCNHSDADNLSVWERRKNNFKYHHKTEFIVDDTLVADLTSLKKASLHILPWIDTVYLYSWQGSDKSKNEFTVVGNEGKYGPSIFYVITNKKDSLISSTRVSGINDSGNEWNNFKTVFVTKDTFFIDEGKTKVSYRDTLEKYRATRSGFTLHAIEENGDVTVIVRDYTDSTNR
jgi:hypothetical protein